MFTISVLGEPLYSQAYKISVSLSLAWMMSLSQSVKQGLLEKFIWPMLQMKNY